MKFSRSFLMPYLIMLVLPVLFEIIVFLSSSRTLRENSLEYNLALLESASGQIEQRFEELDKISALLVENVHIRQLSYQESPMKNVYSLYKAQKSLYDFRSINAVLEEYFIYMKKSDFVINSSLAYRYDQFYGEIFQQGLMSSGDWKKTLLVGADNVEIMGSEKVRLHNSEGDYLTYIKRFPFYGSHSGALIILIDEEELTGFLQDSNKLTGDFVLTDGDGAVLASRGSELLETEDLIPPGPLDKGSYIKDDLVVSYLYSEKWDLYYFNIQKKVMLFKEQNRNITITLIIISVILMMGIPTAVYFAQQNTAARKKMEKKLEEEQALLANLYIGQLLSGENLLNEKEILGQIKDLNLPLAPGTFRATLLELQDSPDDQWSRCKLSLTSFFAEHFRKKIYTYDIKEYNRLVLIISIEGEERHEILDFLDKLEEEMKSLNPVLMHWGISDPCDRYSSLGTSLSQARQALQYLTMNTSESIFFFEDITAVDNYFFFPHELEARLQYAVQSGNTDSVKEIFNQIYEENFQKRHLQTALLGQFTLALWGTMLRTSNQALIKSAAMEKEIHELNLELNHYPPGRRFEQIKEFYLRLAQVFRERQKSGNQDLKGRLQEYILENYTDEGISLSSIGLHLKISEVYVSQFFKEQFGENFSSYLNRLRMEKARRLLEDPHLSLKEIATSVGYSSYNSFSRSFKRTHGVSAGEYRQSPENRTQ